MRSLAGGELNRGTLSAATHHLATRVAGLSCSLWCGDNAGNASWSHSQLPSTHSTEIASACQDPPRPPAGRCLPDHHHRGWNPTLPVENCIPVYLPFSHVEQLCHVPIGLVARDPRRLSVQPVNVIRTEFGV